MNPTLALLVVLAVSLLVVSCANVNETTVQKIYVQDVQLKGPMNQSPIQITHDTKPHQWRIIPRVDIINARRFDGQIEGHTPVNSRGVFQVDTLRDNRGYITGFQEPPGVNVSGFRGKNLDWSLPGVSAALDFDYAVGRDFSATFGFNYALVGQKDFWGFRGGIGLHGEGGAAAFRIDVGAHIQSLSYDAKTVITSQTGSSPPQVLFFYDHGTDTHVNPYAAFTINSAKRDWPANFFVEVSLHSQDLINFKPQEPDEVVERDILGNTLITTDMRADKTATFISVTPGVYFAVTPSMHVLVGARFTMEARVEDLSPDNMVSPVIQFDFTP